MSKLETVEILFTDLEEVRQVLSACASYFYAVDFERAQLAFSSVTKSPLTREIEVVQTRFDGYLGDYLRQRYEAGLDQEINEEDEALEDEEMPDTILGVEIDKSEESESEEPLPSLPLGEPAKPKRGRRITKKELQERAAQEAE